MKALQLTIEGNWGHFKKPETNNNPLTHDFITKTALVGMIGAVLGKDRDEMRHLFPQLCDDLLYGVQIVNPVKKESWGFTMRKAVNLFEKAPKYLEFLKQPKFFVSVAIYNERSMNIFNEFVGSVKKSRAVYTPVLGLHNCPANLLYISEGEFSERHVGSFEAKCFVSNKHNVDIQRISQFLIGLDKIPTFQDNDFWNLPDRYVTIIYPSGGREISISSGEYYQYTNGEKWWLI